MTKVKLNILGLSNSQSQTGAYALILSEEHGQRRLPIIIGAFEAQSIALQLEGLFPPRPLTHDLFFNFAESFEIKLTEVNIYKLEEGVFYSILVCEQGENKLKVDARTSDAVALALRFKCPIFTSEDILEKAGIYLDDEEVPIDQPAEGEEEKTSQEKWENYSVEELDEMLNEAIDQENYEKASELRDIIEQRKK
jgi:uncharacterized protein